MHYTTILALLATVGAVSAQTPSNLIGLTQNTPIIAQHDHNACAPLPPCPSSLPPAVGLPPFVGGSAYDPIRGQIWNTEGTLIEAVDMTTCTVNCPPSPVPVSSPNAFATGLAFVESLNQLWIIDSLGVITQCQNACPPIPLAQCNTGLAPGFNSATSGLAIDEGNGLVFYSYTNFNTGASRIYVAQIANPCAAFHIHTVFGCGTPNFGPVNGLAVDWCNQTLYVSNGRQTQALTYNYNSIGPAIGFVFQSCCIMSWVNELYIGLCVRPGGATSVGASCANGSCAPCPMVHSLRNDPNLGNAFFRLGLDQAQPGSLSFAVIGAGPCNPIGPVPPPFCGPFLIGPSLGNLGPNIVGGGGACGGSTSFSLPLPVIPGLCGAILSSQVVSFCSSGGAVGTSMSNCLSWQLQGS